MGQPLKLPCRPASPAHRTIAGILIILVQCQNHASPDCLQRPRGHALGETVLTGAGQVLKATCSSNWVGPVYLPRRLAWAALQARIAAGRVQDRARSLPTHSALSDRSVRLQSPRATPACHPRSFFLCCASAVVGTHYVVSSFAIFSSIQRVGQRHSPSRVPIPRKRSRNGCGPRGATTFSLPSAGMAG